MLVLFGVNAAKLAYLAAVLVCPLMMVFLMRGMMGGDSHAGGQHPDHQPSPSATEPPERTR